MNLALFFSLARILREKKRSLRSPFAERKKKIRPTPQRRRDSPLLELRAVPPDEGCGFVLHEDALSVIWQWVKGIPPTREPSDKRNK